MNVMVQMKLRNHEGALERVLGKIRFRGVQLSKLMVDVDEQGHFLDVTCKMVASPKQRQLNKQLCQMVDVFDVRVYGELALAQ